jgi:hypothetical protein
MTDRLTIKDRWYNARHHVSVLLAAFAVYRALGQRGRNGIWVFWVSLEGAERERNVTFLKVAMQRCWHLARDPDVILP